MTGTQLAPAERIGIAIGIAKALYAIAWEISSWK